MTKTMDVGVYYSNNDIRIEKQPFPKIGDNDILLKVMSSGICGSDLMEFHRIKKAPFVPGHELSGIIEKVGKNITDYDAGDRIFVTHHVPCDSCRSCLNNHKTACNEFRKINNFSPGGFAPYVRVGGRSLKTGAIKLDDKVSYDQASFIEPLGTAVEIAEPKNGGTVLVLGCGVAGILNIQLAKAYGAGKIIATDINQERLDYAKRFGADKTINAKGYSPELLKEMNNNRLADEVIICAGAKQATEQAFQSYEDGGRIIFFATPPEKITTEIEWYLHWRKHPTIKTTYGATPKANQTSYELIKHNVVDVENMITHKLPLEELAKGFEIASKGQGLKVLINPHL